MSSPSTKWRAPFACAASTRRHLAAWVFAILVVIPPVAAQTSNLSLFQEMAVACLGDLPPEADRVILQAPGEMPYLRSVLVSTWQDDGREVFLEDAPGTRVTYAIEDASVAYARRGDDLAREVRLTLTYTISAEDGLVLADERCAEQRGDTFARSDLDVVQSEAYPETQADPPRGGWLRRVLEPAVLTAATGVAVYLFFSLRSTGGDDT